MYRDAVRHWHVHVLERVVEREGPATVAFLNANNIVGQSSRNIATHHDRCFPGREIPHAFPHKLKLHVQDIRVTRSETGVYVITVDNFTTIVPSLIRVRH